MMTDSEFDRKKGAEVRRWREAAKITRRALADRMGVKHYVVERLERGLSIPRGADRVQLRLAAHAAITDLRSEKKPTKCSECGAAFFRDSRHPDKLHCSRQCYMKAFHRNYSRRKRAPKPEPKAAPNVTLAVAYDQAIAATVDLLGVLVLEMAKAPAGEAMSQAHKGLSDCVQVVGFLKKQRAEVCK